MKKYSLILLMLSFVVVTLASFTINNNEPTIENVNSFSDYCDGWESGHCEGWRDVFGLDQGRSGDFGCQVALGVGWAGGFADKTAVSKTQ